MVASAGLGLDWGFPSHGKEWSGLWIEGCAVSSLGRLLWLGMLLLCGGSKACVCSQASKCATRQSPGLGLGAASHSQAGFGDPPAAFPPLALLRGVRGVRQESPGRAKALIGFPACASAAVDSSLWRASASAARSWAEPCFQPSWAYWEENQGWNHVPGIQDPRVLLARSVTQFPHHRDAHWV